MESLGLDGMESLELDDIDGVGYVGIGVAPGEESVELEGEESPELEGMESLELDGIDAGPPGVETPTSSDPL